LRKELATGSYQEQKSDYMTTSLQRFFLKACVVTKRLQKKKKKEHFKTLQHFKTSQESQKHRVTSQPPSGCRNVLYNLLFRSTKLLGILVAWILYFICSCNITLSQGTTLKFEKHSSMLWKQRYQVILDKTNNDIWRHLQSLQIHRIVKVCREACVSV